MKIAHIFNNNVVLARNHAGEEFVVIGKGIAFHKKKGEELDHALVEQTFVPQHNMQNQRSSTLLAEIPAPILASAAELETYARETLNLPIRHSFVLPVADHLFAAIQRAVDNIHLEFPLAADISQLYPRELEFGKYVVRLANQRFGVELDPREATAFAMHLVNTQFSQDDLGKTFKMTEVFSQIFTVISFAYHKPLDQNRLSVARFITHLRYLFIRMEAPDHNMRRTEIPAVQQVVTASYPTASSCARKVRVLLEMHLGVDLSDNEQTYLTLHIARLAEDLWGFCESHDGK